MTAGQVSDFRVCALASGLVSNDQLEQAEAMLREAADDPGAAAIDYDQRLARQLVALQWLTPFQADRLLAGTWTFQLGPYRIVDSLGKGGMGHVFKAEHALMGRTVAVKVLPLQKSTPEATERFLREIRVHAQLDHPHLVRALDAGHSGNVYYLVTEYISGEDLRRIVRRYGAMSEQNAAWIAIQIAKGLEHAHSRGIMHRDVKPGNVLVTLQGTAKLLDLGLVGFLDAETQGSDQLSNGRIVGTADYLSPEQIRSPNCISPASDVYSLGCTLYYAVTGKVPFPGGSTRDKCHRHLNVPPLDPRRLNPELSEAFVDLMGDMMEKDVKLRIATCARVLERLAPWAKCGWQGLNAPGAADPEVARLKPPLVEPPEASSLSDTQAVLLPEPEAEPDHLDRHGEVSQGTVPVASSAQETVREVIDLREPRAPRWWRRLTFLQCLLLFLIPGGLGFALFVIWTIVSSIMK